MDYSQCAHLWANRSREHGTAGRGRMFFRDDVIYSYGGHFPIARHYKGVVLFTTRGYSVTTAGHKSCVLSACRHLTVFHVEDVLAKPSGKTVKEYAGRINHLIGELRRARNPHSGSLRSLVDEANRFCQTFKFKTRFSLPDDIEALDAKGEAWRERRDERRAEARAKREKLLAAMSAERIEKWLAGDSVATHLLYGLPVYLRARGDTMETSRGAKVPLADAERTFGFVKKLRDAGREWQANGEQHPIGEFRLSAVNAQGVVAGCHRVSWEEIERFAKSQGWLS